MAPANTAGAAAATAAPAADHPPVMGTGTQHQKPSQQPNAQPESQPSQSSSSQQQKLSQSHQDGSASNLSSDPSAEIDPDSDTTGDPGITTLTRLMVAVRIRPLTQKERDRDTITTIATASDDTTVVVTDPTEDFLEDILRKDRQREKNYEFDHVFGDTADQITVFDNTVKYLIDSVLHGFNATVFAYGATGAGKTYTMMGTETCPGIMVLTLADLFAKISADSDACGGSYDVVLSYLEIYNENIRDLLSGKADILELRDDGSRGVVVAGITYMPARSPEEVLSFLRRGNKNRSQETTGANEVSSRSHAVLQVFVTYHLVDPYGQHIHRFAKLSMIDLAGSERAAETNNRGLRMIEGANINRSLLALGNCINALIEPGKKNRYINYRDSKLTRLLKDSLGGNCRTVMIANISPSSLHFDETLNTLKYASRARTIKTKITQQVSFRYDPVVSNMQQLQSEISRLKPQVELTKDALPRVQARHGRLSSNTVDHDDVKWVDGGEGSVGVNGGGDRDGISKSHTVLQLRRAMSSSSSSPPHLLPVQQQSSKQAHQRHASQPQHESSQQKHTAVSNGRQARVSPDHTIFREIRDTLEVLFTEQLDLRTKLLDADETDAELAISITQKQTEFSQLDYHNGSDKKGSIDSSQLDNQRHRIQSSITDLIQQRQHIHQLKASIDTQMQTLDDKIKTVQNTMPNQVERRTRQYIGLQTKAHYLEMDNLDLDLNYTLSRVALKQRESELKHVVMLLDRYREAFQMQNGVLEEHRLGVTGKLQHLCDEIGDLERGYGDGSFHVGGEDRDVVASRIASQSHMRMQSLNDRFVGRGISAPGTLVGGNGGGSDNPVTADVAGNGVGNATEHTKDPRGKNTVWGSGLIKLMSGKKVGNEHVMEVIPSNENTGGGNHTASSVNGGTEHIDSNKLTISRRKSKRDVTQSKGDGSGQAYAGTITHDAMPTGIDASMQSAMMVQQQPAPTTSTTAPTINPVSVSGGSYAAKNKGSYARLRQPAADPFAPNPGQSQWSGSPLKEPMQTTNTASVDYTYSATQKYTNVSYQQTPYFKKSSLESFPTSMSSIMTRPARVHNSYAQQQQHQQQQQQHQQQQHNGQMARRDRTNPFVPQERRLSFERRKKSSQTSLTEISGTNVSSNMAGVSNNQGSGYSNTGNGWSSRSETIIPVQHRYASATVLSTVDSNTLPPKPKTPRVMPVLHSKLRTSRSTSVVPDAFGLNASAPNGRGHDVNYTANSFDTPASSSLNPGAYPRGTKVSDTNMYAMAAVAVSQAHAAGPDKHVR